MKVIQQLIAYFEERSRLTPRHVDQLMERGYWGEDGPPDLRGLESRIGKSFFFRVTGDANGPLWGTDVYTSDSSLAKACVHMGVLEVGESGVVKVTVVQPIPIYHGSTRHGVSSHDWTSGWSGAYRVEAVRK